MRAVIQRVSEANVEVEGEIVGSISRGYLVLLGVAADDDRADVEYIVKKVRDLRLFSSDNADFDLPIGVISGEILVVSQFTLLADCRKGRRPDWAGAAGAGEAEPFYRAVIDALRCEGLVVQEGRFGAKMSVGLINDGPVTIVLDSRRESRST